MIVKIKKHAYYMTTITISEINFDFFFVTIIIIERYFSAINFVKEGIRDFLNSIFNEKII